MIHEPKLMKNIDYLSEIYIPLYILVTYEKILKYIGNWNGFLIKVFPNTKTSSDISLSVSNECHKQ